VVSLVSILQMPCILQPLQQLDDSDWLTVKHNTLGEIGVHEDSTDDLKKKRWIN